MTVPSSRVLRHSAVLLPIGNGKKALSVLQAVAAIPLWTDTYPDGPADMYGTDKLTPFISTDIIRLARQLVGVQERKRQEHQHCGG